MGKQGVTGVLWGSLGLATAVQPITRFMANIAY